MRWWLPLETYDSRSVLGLPLAVGPLIGSALTVFCAVLLVKPYWSVGGVVALLARLLVFTSLCDSFTAGLSIVTGSAQVAYTAFIGFCVEYVVQLVLVALNLAAMIKNRKQGKRFIFNFCWVLCGAVFGAWLGYILLRITFAYYVVLAFGGSGWEYKSPREMKDDWAFRKNMDQLPDISEEDSMLREASREQTRHNEVEVVI